jgi:hypothetical protein
MLATVAALVILLGLMVSLARYVRRQASEQFTKQLLAQLDVLISRYHDRHHGLPDVPAFLPGVKVQSASRNQARTTTTRTTTRPALPLLPPGSDENLPPEIVLKQNAQLNNRGLVQALRVEARRYPAEYASLPPSFFAEDDTLRDAWGTPIVFMPGLHPAVGMAMENRPFFLSAGPDRLFRTQEDNLFSYEEEHPANAE